MASINITAPSGFMWDNTNPNVCMFVPIPNSVVNCSSFLDCVSCSLQSTCSYTNSTCQTALTSSSSLPWWLAPLIVCGVPGTNNAVCGPSTYNIGGLTSITSIVPNTTVPTNTFCSWNLSSNVTFSVNLTVPSSSLFTL